jgi:hypothetical protein
MVYLLTLAKVCIGMGILLSLLAVIFGGPGFLTLFLSIGQVTLLVGIVLYLTVVLRDLKQRDVL